MIKHAAFFGIVIGLAAGIPSVYQTHKASIHAAFASSDAKEVRAYNVTPSRRRTDNLSGRAVRIPMDSRGHFNADFKMNGRRVGVLVDTGATLVALNASTARRIGMKIKSADYQYDVETANGKTKAAAGYIDEISIGRIRVRNVPALVMKDSALNGTLLGMSFLKELDSFTVSDRELILEQ